MRSKVVYRLIFFSNQVVYKQTVISISKSNIQQTIDFIFTADLSREDSMLRIPTQFASLTKDGFFFIYHYTIPTLNYHLSE